MRASALGVSRLPRKNAPECAAVSVHGLTKRYGKRTVVDGFDLELP